MMIAPRSVLCGGQGAADMGLFARTKERFLRCFLKLSNGLRSHDSFSRLFRRLDAEQFQTAFQRFMTTFSGQCRGVVAIEGKVLRRSFDRAGGKSPLHMVSAHGQRVGLRTTPGAGADRHSLPPRKSAPDLIRGRRAATTRWRRRQIRSRCMTTSDCF
jgi:DDE_Tnp_1-associated